MRLICLVCLILGTQHQLFAYAGLCAGLIWLDDNWGFLIRQYEMQKKYRFGQETRGASTCILRGKGEAL